VAYWKFDECQGTTAYDSSGNGNNGSINIGASAPQTSAGTCTSGNSTDAWYNGRNGKRNYSISLDGTDDHVVVSDDIALDQDSSFSLSTWVKFDTISGNSFYILEKGVNGGAANYYLWWNNNAITPNNSLFCGFYDGSAYRDHTYSWTPTTDEWYHITCAFDDENNNLKIFINGKQVLSEAENNNSPVADNGNLNIGQSRTAAGKFDRQIDDVRIYNYALTETQVKTLYNQGAIRFGPESGSP